MVKGRESAEDKLKPGDWERLPWEDVRRCSNCGFVVEVYCPGIRCTRGAPWVKKVSPTNVKLE